MTSREGFALRALGAAALFLFWVPLLAPLVQAAALVMAMGAAWRGSADRVSVAAAAGGAALGAALFLALQYLWVI